MAIGRAALADKHATAAVTGNCYAIALESGDWTSVKRNHKKNTERVGQAGLKNQKMHTFQIEGVTPKVTVRRLGLEMRFQNAELL